MQAGAEEVRQRINSAFEKLYRISDKWYEPYVCIICDQLLKRPDVKCLSSEVLEKSGWMLTPNEWNSVPSNLAQCYEYAGDCGDYGDYGDVDELREMLHSPRGCFVRQDDGRRREGFSCCGRCNDSLKAGVMPKFAIANNYCFGTPPTCLLDLTDVELALLTPVKTYGYCFSYTGGVQKQLKGSLSYYKVDMSSIARTAMHFDVLGLSSNIVVILHGHMTPEQQSRARQKNKIRTNYVLAALQWLMLNNEEWRQRNINLDEIRQKLTNPLLVDNSKTVECTETGNSNVENSESFEVFFPDGSMSQATGGQDKLETFKELVRSASVSGYDIALRSNLMKEAVADFKDSNLVNACLLQFPFGRGGMHEKRMNSNGSFTCSTDVADYVGHISRVSQRHFHHELFSLILYNLSMKQAMVRTAGWRVRNKADAHTLAEELTAEDVSDAIRSRGRGGRSRNERGEGYKLLNAVDAIATAVPHTNEAAKQARRNGEAMQHHFGTSSYFLTVTPDDDNSFLVQVYSGVIIDDDLPIESLTDEELAARAKKRTELRMKFPGVCALFFEAALEIVIEEVIGWDVKRGKAKEGVAGLFGVPLAFVAAVEEQGRGTLHAHMQIWVKAFSEWRELLHSIDRSEQRDAAKKIEESMDNVGRCSLFFNNSDGDRTTEIPVMKAFPHECIVTNPQFRRNPVVVDDQKLRYLRYKDGSHGASGMLAYCPHCTTSWTSEELVESYLMNGVNVPGLTKYPDNEVRRLKAMAVEYQKSAEGNTLNTCIIDAAYNHHSHTSTSCFGKHGSNAKTSTDRKRKAAQFPQNFECRYRCPHRKKRKTIVQNASETEIQWYDWHGSSRKRFIKEVCVRRKGYDAFQNVCCHAISHSKLTCNTNVSAVMPGPLGQYNFKYNLKDTQEQDTEEYGRVKESMQKILSKVRTYELDRSEAMKRVLAGSFAHLKTNVLRASMARYLTWNKTRFIFSHDTVWCPLRDLRSALNGRGVDASVVHHGSLAFFQCVALHYLCRPVELEALSAFDFYSKYEVIRVTSQNESQLLEFYDGGPYQHPSYSCKKERFLQGVRERTVGKLVKIYQYDFPDAAEFGGSLLDEDMDISESMETYSELVLLLFYPYRKLEDLTLFGSYTESLRDAIYRGIIGETAETFLQNLQDTKSNSFRVTRLEDDLQRNTEPLQKVSVQQAGDALLHVEDNVHEEDEVEGRRLDELLDLLDAEGNNTEEDDDQEARAEIGSGGTLPESISLAEVRNKGSERCGYEWLAQMELNETGLTDPVIEVEEADTTMEDISTEATEQEQEFVHQTNPNQHEIVKVLISRRRRRSRTFEEITRSREVVDVLEANGSARSIIDWAIKAKLDREQRRAFEIITSTFVLTFFKDAAIIDTRGLHGVRHTFVGEKDKLKKLADVQTRQSEQLICLLHGPGGCGKTTAIDLVMSYAMEYCSYLENYKFTSKTIILTAMTGVAATLLLGETTHSAVYLNQRKPIQAEQVELWADTRLVIIDEISFASKADFEELHKKMRMLKQQLDQRYGGVNIVFAGDMRQLEPVGAGKKPIYTENCPEFKDWVNCFIELKGMHRFKDDPEWGELLLRFRNGEVTWDDIDKINERVVRRNCTILPKDIKYATFFNRDRDAINAALFEERLNELHMMLGETCDSVMIFSDDLKVQNSTKAYVPFHNCAAFWESCAEDDVRLPKGGATGRMDPVLRLYKGCRVMLPSNTSVKEGQANGTQAILERVVLKSGERPGQVLVDGTVPIAAVLASQVSHVVLRHSNKRIQPSCFSLKPKEHSFTARIPKPKILQVKGSERESIKMKAVQIPLIINNATTGHKLQGSSVDSVFVHDWSYRTNWVYVMLSRVRTREGLFCRKMLSKDLGKYAMPDGLQRMLQQFRTRSPTYWNDDDYEEIFG